MLRESHRVTDCRRPLRTRRPAHRLSHSKELLAWNSAVLLNELRRIPRKMPLQHLVHATRILQAHVAVVALVMLCFAAAVLSLTASLSGVTRPRSRSFLRLHAIVEPRQW